MIHSSLPILPALFICCINVNQHPRFYNVNIFSNVCEFYEFRRIVNEFYHTFHDFGILDLRTTEPFRSECRAFFGLANIRTYEVGPNQTQ